MSVRPHVALAAVLALALAAAPSRADAQLGGMLKKAAKAAATKAVEKKVGGAEQQGESAESDPSDGPRTATDSLYEIVHPRSSDLQTITPDLLAKFFAGYAEEHKLMTRDDACLKRAYETPQWKALTEQATATEAEQAALEKRQGAYTLKECGVDSNEPDAHAFRQQIVGAKTAGLSPRHYAMVRERVLAFAAMAAKYNTGNFRGYKFSGAERQALEARAADARVLLEDYRGR